jgi:hypothetical protein
MRSLIGYGLKISVGYGSIKVAETPTARDSRDSALARRETLEETVYLEARHNSAASLNMSALMPNQNNPKVSIVKGNVTTFRKRPMLYKPITRRD